MTTGFVDVPDGGRLAFEDAGEGPVVVLIHPGLWDMRTWDPQVPTFVDAGFRVLRYDVRGYGRSSRPDPGIAYSHVRDLQALLDAREVETTAIVGCSMGGEIDLDFALTHPDRVWALVLVSPGLGGFEATQEEDDWFADLVVPIEAAVAAGDLERAQDLRLELLWAPLGTDDEAGRRIREIAFDNLHELTMDESGAEELDPPAAHRLHEVDLPTLVMKAEADPPYMRRIADVIAAGVVDGRVVQIEDADHVVNLRRPSAFDAAVLAFLEEVRP
ncbi:MAG: alpha/beta fold hydrolase [Planctomycetaceae bacterium]